MPDLRFRHGAPGGPRAVRAPPCRRSVRLARLLLLPALSLAASQAARAEENTCRGVPRLSENAPTAQARVAGAGRIPFLKDGLAGAGCPTAAAACRERAYLVAGDPVLLGARQGGYVCASYFSARSGDTRTGWLPADAVAEEPATAVTAADWHGTWKRVEAQVAIGPGARPGSLAVSGHATWGAGDPERVRRGGIHLGTVEGTVAPSGASLSFAVGDRDTLPVEKGGAYDCKVWMRRVGPWLVVDDNLACGGMNVSFRGLYGRAP